MAIDCLPRRPEPLYIRQISPTPLGERIIVAKGLSLLYHLSHSLWRMLCQLTGGMMPASIHP